MPSMFDKTCDFNDDLFRNIVSLRESVDLFSDLTDDDEYSSEVAITAEMRVKSEIPTGLIKRGFHYTTAIGYPFETDPYLSSRYGNGAFGVWYGSLELETTIHETAYHMIQEELRVEGSKGPIIRERAVYQVHCRAVLIDLRGKEKQFADLVSNDYSLTHQIGERLHNEGHPGLLVPSARCKGTNLASFAPSILSNPRNHCYLTYRCYPERQSVTVEREQGQVYLEIS
ncbi:MAG: RES family NAD+ phosphorylase [Desulfuromonadaceae bacterium]|nr:RES family NAD+ phosphorylase [Desulfuromonadaceae bacterium]